jgi:GR25 family glycosyltransferase involved in LPS biosynthesis
MCYTFQVLEEKSGLYDDFLECVYVITMENSFKRHKNIEDQFKKYNLCKNTIIVKNKGFKLEKTVEIGKKKIKVDNTQTDLTHANITILKHSISQNYKNILILEDDFILSDIICETTNIDNIKREVNNNGNQIISLGTLPYISSNFNDNFYKNIISVGTQAQIYNLSNINNILKFINNVNYYDWDAITGNYGRIVYKKPLIYQIFPETDNFKNWYSELGEINGKYIRNIVRIAFNLLSLDKIPEPGTSFFYKYHIKI